MRRVSLLLKEVFLAAFDTAASTNLREIPKRIEDHMTREQLIELADVDFDLQVSWQLVQMILGTARLADDSQRCCAPHRPADQRDG
jgi:hypothetical protein